MTILSQRSFASGEIAPALYARCDTTKYLVAVRTLRNTIIPKSGGSANRAGTRFVGEAKDSSKTIRLIPFVFNSSQTYMLEFGDLYMRVIRDGEQVTLDAQNITAVSSTNPAVVTYSGSDTLVEGDEVYISGIVGAIGDYLNNRNFKVGTVVSGSNTFELKYMDGTAVNATGFGSYTSGGTFEEIYTITTPYVEADLDEIRFVQSADVLTIVHPSYAPRELSRTGHASWTLSEITFAPDTDRPVDCLMASVAAGTGSYKWRITAVAGDTREESLYGYSEARTITNITQAAQAVVTYTGDDPVENDEVYISGVVGMTEVNGIIFTAVNVNAGANTFELVLNNNFVDTTGYTAYSSGGTWKHPYVRANSADVPTVSVPHIIAWDSVDGAVEYNIYEEKNGIYGYIGTSATNRFNVIGTAPDTTDTPPIERNPFEGAGNYPSTVTYYQQRLGFANTTNAPETCWFSKSAQFKNFTVKSPIQSDDAVTFTLVGRQVNEVKHMLDAGRLLIMTSGGEHGAEGDSAGILRPGEINQRQFSANGSGTLPPMIIGNSILYVQARGSVVRDFGFDEVKGSEGQDLTTFASHLVDKYTIVDWTYQQIPNSMLWMVRSDGVLLGLTYVKEQQILAWHHHDFEGGTVENVCAIPEDQEDVVYVVVKRTIDGRTTRYIEQLQSRFIDVDDYSTWYFMDSALAYDGRNTDTSHTMTLSGGTDWDYEETLTLTSSASYFASSDVGKEIHLTGADGTIVRFSIVAYTSATVVTGTSEITVPVAMRSTAISNWSKAISVVKGLWHLEGEEVSVLADGFVAGSPYNPEAPSVTVTNGAITLDRCYAVVQAGLPYLSDLETLDIDTAQSETLIDKNKLVTSVHAHVEKSRGLWAGAQPPEDDSVDALENLEEFKVRDEEDYDSPVELQTGVIEIAIPSEWNSNGRVFLRQVDPLPIAILSVSPGGVFPFRGGG
jgi:hypothetical protein